VVAYVARYAFAGAVYEALDVGPDRTSGEPFLLEEARRVDGRCDSGGAPRPPLGIPEERAQRCCTRRDGYTTPVLSTFRFEKGIDVADGDRCNRGFVRGNVLQEAFNLPPPTAERIWRQAALVPQVSDKIVNLPREDIPPSVR